ncbi:uncharacterized protein LOC125883277 [Epinephelus fuscoguttatus]|uniref:uncharacterized protein LOC125883277 n=1 Tax=Epinephelus fuscoguttatus TaxID=293821 RepID=UPI0020D0381F|nr:uncharacterized protein LOC125883277 [Epinephelus fuscoguttatus]XP_049423463.1 uncharacterized protein LOC125883277 [Epinephelus fuscoguttatus]XP_049423464.1 uncharacterized protein LOC125883277 [Epinephelus fuscoguttatus]
MTKGKAKMSSSVTSAPPQPRTLRSRKRECPSDETSETDDAQAALHQQDTEGNKTAVNETLLQCHQSPLQESTVISAQQREAAEQASLTKQDPDTGEKHTEATNVNFKNVTAKTLEEQEGTAVTNPNNDSELEVFRVPADNDADESGKDKEEMTREDCNRSPSQKCADQLKVCLPISEKGDGSALEEQVGAKGNSRGNLESNQEEPVSVYVADVKEIPKEAAAGLPAKKKRRMGMCGLTERERSHFLQMQKHENGQKVAERVEKQICINTTDLQPQEEIISSPTSSSSLSISVGSVTERREAEIKLQSSHCGGDDRAETEVHNAISDATEAASNPGCLKGKSCGVEGGTESGPEQTGDTKSDPPAVEEEEQVLGNQEQQEPEGHTAEIVAAQPQEQMKEDGSAVIDQSPAITFYSNPTQNEETENPDAAKAAPVSVNGVIGTRHESKRELVGEAGASSTSRCSGGFKAVELCKAAVTPSGSERKDSCNYADEPGAGPSTVNAEPPETQDSSDPFGSGCLDYVSDSQLYTIVLTEEEVMERDEEPGSPDHHEDATQLICGLITELSSLNRKVMAAHRELESLRRSSKSSRSSVR